MDAWVERSIEIALNANYLDQIQAVYPAERMGDRDIPGAVLREIVAAHTSKDARALIVALLKLEKFPIQDPRIAFLKKGAGAFERNPVVVKKLGDDLLKIPIEELIKFCKQEKATNTQMGNMFYDWFMALPYPHLKYDDFKKLSIVKDFGGKECNIIMLDGSPKEWRDFADKEIGCGLNKDPDLLVKVNGKYVVGEAKWLGDFGGNQNAHFAEAIDFIHSAHGKATRIAILDGVVWLNTGNRMNLEVRRVEALAMTSLLLKQYLESIR